MATQNNPNTGFETSCLSLPCFLTNMPFLRKQAKRKKNLKHEPCVTKVALTSINKRGEIYKEMIKAMNSQTKQP